MTSTKPRCFSPGWPPTWTVCFYLCLLQQSLHGPVAKMTLLNSKSIMLPLGSKPSSSPHFTSQCCKVLTHNGRWSCRAAALPAPSLASSPATRLLARSTTRAVPPSHKACSSPQRHGRSAGFLCWNASSLLREFIHSLTCPQWHTPFT